MSASSPSPADQGTRLDFIDGLRALAVLAVMAYHLEPAWLPGGFVGVDVFFVISGFVVTASLAGHGHDRLGAFLTGFYARRLLRLMPALVLTLLATTAAYVLLVPQAWFNRAVESVAQSAFWGLSNWVLDRQDVNYFEPRAELNPFTHTWSLGVEEQFYVLAPLLLFGALRAGGGRRGQHLASSAILLLALVSLAACMATGFMQGARAVFYPMAFRFWELGAGVLLYLNRSAVRQALGRVDARGTLSAAAGLALVTIALAAPKTGAYPFVRAALAALGTALLIGHAPERPTDPVRRVFAMRLPVWIGERSYALYLWHWPVYVLARWTVGLTAWPMNALAPALALGLAALSFAAVERPIRRAPRLLALPGVMRIALVGTFVLAGWWTAGELLRRQPELGLGTVTRRAEDWYAHGQLLRTQLSSLRRCEPRATPVDIGDARGAATRFDPQPCGSSQPSRLLVLGDSHATAYLPLLEQISAEQGRLVFVLPTPGCSFLNLREHLDERVHARCARVVGDALQLLLHEARPGDTVFLPALRVPRFVELGGARRPSGDTGDPYTRTPAERAGIARAAAGAATWLQPLFDARLHVVIEAPKPVFRSHPFACVETWNRSNPECRDGLVERRADQERLRQPTQAALRNLALRFPGLEVWDPMPLLCDADHCSALRDGRPLFFDADHLSPYGNLVLLPALRAALTPSAGPIAGPQSAFAGSLHVGAQRVPPPAGSDR